MLIAESTCVCLTQPDQLKFSSVKSDLPLLKFKWNKVDFMSHDDVRRRGHQFDALKQQNENNEAEAVYRLAILYFLLGFFRKTTKDTYIKTDVIVMRLCQNMTIK